MSKNILGIFLFSIIEKSKPLILFSNPLLKLFEAFLENRQNTSIKIINKQIDLKTK